MEPILAGLETEYGLYVEGRGAENQIDDSMALVRAYPGKRFVGWNYRYESPRADLRGFRLDRLQFDPEDARYDAGVTRGSEQDIRSDRILPNGARFYNDHGHPEYSTPECWSLDELVLHDLAGELVVQEAARAYGEKVTLYKNNTDFHGASYGTHENYLVTREFSFEDLYNAVMPMLIARQVLCGAGKVGADGYQLSQRADYIAEAASAETLYRRPLFNTRDEPHADPAKWIRLHVICGDANMIPSATKRKVGLVKLALALLREDQVPVWKIPHPAKAFSSVSKDQTGEFKVEVGFRSWTTALEILESYFSAGEKTLGLHAGTELGGVILECRQLLEAFRECPDRFREKVDWAAKKWLLEQVESPALESYDLAYHNLDPEEGLYFALADAGEVEGRPSFDLIEQRVGRVLEGTRARARGVAIERFGDKLENACWRTLTFKDEEGSREVELRPDVEYPENLGAAGGVEEFIEQLRSL